MRSLMINIWLYERGVGWRPAWQSCCSWCDFIPKARAIYISSCFTCFTVHPTSYQLLACPSHSRTLPPWRQGYPDSTPGCAKNAWTKCDCISSSQENYLIWKPGKKLSIRAKMKCTWSLWMERKKITQRLLPMNGPLENRMRKCSASDYPAVTVQWCHGDDTADVSPFRNLNIASNFHVWCIHTLSSLHVILLHHFGQNKPIFWTFSANSCAWILSVLK